MSFSKLSRLIIKRWYIIVLTILISMIGTVFLKGIFTKKEYSSSASCYVTEVYDLENGVSLSDSMLTNFLNLSKTASILSAVAEDSSIKMLGYTKEELTLALNIYRQNNLITINCTMRDPIDAQLITQAYLNAGLPKIKSFLSDSIKGFEYTIVSAPEEGKVVDSTAFAIYALSVIIGGMLGLAIALLPYMRGKVAYEYTEISTLFNTQLLAVLPDKNIKFKGKTPVDTTALLIDYDAAVGAMLAAIFNNSCNVAMIVPCSNKVDISGIMTRYASISAEQQTTVLVDADFRRHLPIDSINNSKIGLSEYVLGGTAKENIMYTNNNYTFVSAGQACDKALPLLLAGQVSDLIQTLSQDYKSVTIIAPPISDYHDSLSIAKYAKCAVLIIDSTTKSQLVQSAIEKLESGGVKLAGIVMDKYPY